jgi:high-affinity iron transporter
LPLRRIRFCCTTVVTQCALVSLLTLMSMSLPHAARAQEATETSAADEAGAVISLLELADTEYADAVDRGVVINQAEFDEAGEFTAEAVRRLEGLAGNLEGLAGNTALHAPVDSEAARTAIDRAQRMASAIDEKVEPTEFTALTKETTAAVATGWNAVRIRFAAGRPSAQRGARVFRAHCAACHGPAGAGDGPAAAGMEPPPANLAAAVRHAEASLRRDFEVTSFGVPNTAMAGWSEELTLQERWDVATYVQGFRFGAAEVAEGRALALAPEVPVGGYVRAWTDPEEALAWNDLELAELVAGVDPDLDESSARAVVAYLRVQAGEPLEGVPEVDAGAQVSGRLARVDSLVTAALAAVGNGDRETARREAIAAYMAFETLEPALGARDPKALRDVEASFAALRADIASERGTPDRGPLDHALAAAAATLASGPSSWGLAVQSFVIILREGFEAILIIGAIMAFLVKTGHGDQRRVVRTGVVAAIVGSLGVGLLLEALFIAVPARREVLEGVTMLIAVGVLFSVSYWLVSKLQHGKWDKYLKSKMNRAIGAGGGMALGSVAFLAVFREGVETVLFYKALGALSAGNSLPLVLGFVAGLLALTAIYVGFTRLGVRIPMRPFFAMTSGLLYLMAIIFAGAGIAELQEAGVVGFTPVSGVPLLPALGVYPTVETLGAQALLVVLLAGALFVTFGVPRLSASEEPAPAG